MSRERTRGKNILLYDNSTFPIRSARLCIYNAFKGIIRQMHYFVASKDVPEYLEVLTAIWSLLMSHTTVKYISDRKFVYSVHHWLTVELGLGRVEASEVQHLESVT